jgi:ribosome biogenesis protein MAK21
VSKTAVGDSKTKLIRALLQGINRAFPYADCEGDETAEMTDALFRIVHTAPFNTGVQALLLLLHVMTARNVLSDRFYRK